MASPGVHDIHHDIPGEFFEDNVGKDLRVCITSKAFRNEVCYKRSNLQMRWLKHVDGGVKKESGCINVWPNNQVEQYNQGCQD